MSSILSWRGLAALARPDRRGAIAITITIASGLALGSSGAGAQGPVRHTYGDWQLRCDTPAGAQAEQCALVQNVAAEDRPNITLLVIVLKTADGKSRELRVLAPLGVHLPSGLGLKIDNVDVGRAGFMRCIPSGCLAQVILDDNLLNQLKSGKEAIFFVYQTEEQGIGIVVPIAGFGPGYDALH